MASGWFLRLLGADGTSQLKVDSNTGSSMGASRTTNHPLDYGTGGHYQFARVTGTIAAALAANAVLFSFRWGSASFNCVPYYIRTQFQTLTLFTAASLTDFGFDAVIGRTFTASHTGGTAATLTGNMGKVRTSMGTSQIPTNGDIRIATTAALGGGTVTLDTDPFALSQGDNQRVNPAAATEEVPSLLPTMEWWCDLASGHHPLVFAQNEGFVIRNRVVWPAAGTGVLSVQVRWCELPTTMLS